MLGGVVHPLLGPRSDSLLPGTRLEVSPDRLRLVALRDLAGMATGRFDQPAGWVAFRPGDSSAAGTARYGGYSYTQFALPVDADASLDFCFDHGKTLISPRVVLPFFAGDPVHGCCLLAPLDRFHEQVLAVQSGELRWGWHGDLERVPEGFSIELGLFVGEDLRALLGDWGAILRERSEAAAAGRYADPSTSHLSYWTDNGAAYWYRREPGRDLAGTLEAKCEELRADEVPVHAVELDSWFYPHETSRPVQEVGYLDTVPPSGMLVWEPRDDVLPGGIEALRERLGDPPLVLHSRHVSAQSPYVEDGAWWVHGGLAHPKDPAFFARWLRDAAAWGATGYEQDWMWVIWFGVQSLRAESGRARAWQQALDAAAAEHGLSLIWCMPTPADLAEATRLASVVAVRTCDDYRYADDPAVLWTWFLGVNAMAGALGLWPFKDVFFSARGEGIDGDPHPEVEALLSALSAGPVGIGDRIGRTDRDLVMRTCRADGLLVKPDRPIAALGAGLLGAPRRGEALMWADTHSDGWRYLTALHVAESEAPIRDGLALEQERLVYDWRAGTAALASRIDVSLEHRGWALYVVCPVEDGRALIGDPAVYATMGDRRVRPIDARTAEVYGAPGERVTVRWWTEDAGVVDVDVEVGGDGWVTARLDSLR